MEILSLGFVEVLPGDVAVFSSSNKASNPNRFAKLNITRSQADLSIFPHQINHHFIINPCFDLLIGDADPHFVLTLLLEAGNVHCLILGSIKIIDG